MGTTPKTFLHNLFLDWSQFLAYFEYALCSILCIVLLCKPEESSLISLCFLPFSYPQYILRSDIHFIVQYFIFQLLCLDSSTSASFNMVKPFLWALACLNVLHVGVHSYKIAEDCGGK
jgi:hypothetical protein